MEQQKQHGIVRRAAGGLGKAWAYSIGLTGLYRTTKRIGGNLSAVGEHIHRQLNDSEANYRHESFNDACESLNLDEEHLIRQARIFKRYAAWCFLSTMVATAWLAYVPFTDRPFSAFLLTVGIIFVTGSQWLKWHFRFCQIRDQSLEQGFVQWLLNPWRW
ncbi:MAG: hypothetical protein K2P67_07405 [Gallionellaceae bacterium]|nr:hypothetical protein [Gallionellaceae bacterium]